MATFEEKKQEYEELMRNKKIAISMLWGHEDYYSFPSWTCAPDSCGGFAVQATIKNISTKTIDYVTIYLVPYDAIYNEVSCTITKEIEKTVRFTGPLLPGVTSGKVTSPILWYNPNINLVLITKAIITYSDGTTEIAEQDEITCILSDPTKGCYVATCVYGSYDCPEVWTLRRFRDDTLGATWYGRLFIRTYYAISPTLVKWFGHTNWFKNMWRGTLDRMVKKLQSNGVKNTPYTDKKW